MTDDQARRILAKVNEICQTASCTDCRFFYEEYKDGHTLGCMIGNWSARVSEREE